MLSHEERVTEVKRRIAEKEQQKRLRKGRIAAFSGIAACFAVMISAALSMPGIVSKIEPGDSSAPQTAAAMSAGTGALGYVVIGLLAFILGICVTILCFRVRQLSKEEHAEKLRHAGEAGQMKNPYQNVQTAQVEKPYHEIQAEQAEKQGQQMHDRQAEQSDPVIKTVQAGTKKEEQADGAHQ